MNQDLLPFVILGVTTLIALIGWLIRGALAKTAKLALIEDHLTQLRDDVISQLKKDVVDIKLDINAVKNQLNAHIIEETKGVTEVTTKLDQIMKYIDRSD